MEVNVRLYAEAVKTLAAAGIVNPGFEARQMLASAFGANPGILPESIPFTPEGDAIFKDMLRRRIDGEPLQYILGEWDFYGVPIAVGEGALIPRPETEMLVELALAECRRLNGPVLLWDICAGSGCVAVACAVHEPRVAALAVEADPVAAEYCRKNIDLNGVGERVELFVGDAFGGAFAKGRAAPDIILCNPPYIPTGEIPSLQREVLREPRIALDGGADGLDFYRILTGMFADMLRPGGLLLYEVGAGQAGRVSRLCAANGLSTETMRDFYGVDRVVYARKQEEGDKQDT